MYIVQYWKEIFNPSMHSVKNSCPSQDALCKGCFSPDCKGALGAKVDENFFNFTPNYPLGYRKKKLDSSALLQSKLLPALHLHWLLFWRFLKLYFDSFRERAEGKKREFFLSFIAPTGQRCISSGIIESRNLWLFLFLAQTSAISFGHVHFSRHIFAFSSDEFRASFYL